MISIYLLCGLVVSADFMIFYHLPYSHAGISGNSKKLKSRTIPVTGHGDYRVVRYRA
jgi:phenylpropionate dioxygenase-like ring-hydroxylating dioxygenase large terminal subunit